MGDQQHHHVYLEVHHPSGMQMFHLSGDRCTVGKSRDNAVVLDHDDTVSRVHASFEPYGPGWSVRDLGSRNGTFVNGDRVVERVLRNRDEIRLGNARMIFHTSITESTTATRAPEPPPEITRREKEILVALCRPTYRGDFFTAPASVREIAQELFVTEAAVKQHLSRLYDKFRIHEGEKRVRLANEAIGRRAVTLDDLRQEPRRERRPSDEDEDDS